jgi:PAS domain S-box-containing protein
MNEPSAAKNEASKPDEGRLLATLSGIGEAVITADLDDRITFLNPVAEALTGWSQEAVGEPLDRVVRIVDEENGEPVELPTARALRDGRAVETARRRLLLARDGTERSITGNASPLRNDRGEVTGVVLDLRDITEQRDAARSLEKAVWYARDIISTLREPFLVLGSDLRVDTANRAFYRTFEVSPEETEDSFLFDLGNGQWDIPGLRKLLEEVVSRHEPIEDHEVDHTFPNLGRRIMLLNARPFPPDSKTPESILLAIQDVTPQRESALQERAEELAEIDRRKNEFLATLAHELRNPLAPIRSGLEVIRLSGSEGEVVRRASDMMERQVGQMARLVDDLIDISRINRGEIELRRERIDLASSLRHAVEAVRSYCEEVDLTLTVTFPSQPIHVTADPVRLEQVVGNLLTNACKFTDKGGHVSLAVEAEDGLAIIRVRDNGIGIAPDQLPQIFDLFMRADSRLDRMEKGLGIGLALVKHLVEKHGGTIEARSSGLGHGSEFVVRLPVAQAPGRSSRKSAATETGGGESTPAASGRILVVDDNRDAARSLAMLLGFAGYETHTVFDGMKAIEAVPRIRPQAVVLDIGMPNMDGYEVCRRIRQEPWGEDIVIIAVSGWGHEEVRERAKEAGFNGHLVKPVEFADLRKLLSEILPSGD